ncbi:putative gustatory receptor 39b [Drosophila montana]|uniref:putative gustatory receptor 39b n=1 Tax=Drosophila montana TaxID=40370 RepID=UPI00313BF6FB
MLYALQRYLKYFAILGLVPWSEKAPQQQLQKIYTIFIIFLNLGVAFYIVFFASPVDDLLVSMLVSCTVFISQIVTMSVVELQVMCQYKRYYEFCLQLKCLRLHFQCELQQPVKGWPWTRYVKYFVLGIINFVSLFPSVYVVLHFDYIGYFWFSLGAVFINRVQCLLLLLYAELLGYHVELLDRRLQAVHSYRLLGAHSQLNVKFEQMCSLEYLLSLKRAYMELYRLFELYNGLFGWSIVCIFVVMFLDSIVNIYWSLLVLTDIYSFVFIYMTCSTFVPLLILIFIFCRCGEYCKRQHMLVGSHVRGLACAAQCQAVPPTLAYNAVLAEFAMQVEQDALIISAEGFMDIDYSLLMSIFTAMVTYLIVLMQFGSLYT